MKSAMSTKVYWKARKLIQSIGFRCKSLLYTYMDRAEVIKESSSIKHVIARQALKEGIRGVIIQINNTLKAFFAGSNVGEMVLHLKNRDYQELWGNYSKGKITKTELMNTLFKSY